MNKLSNNSIPSIRTTTIKPKTECFSKLPDKVTSYIHSFLSEKDSHSLQATQSHASASYWNIRIGTEFPKEYPYYRLAMGKEPASREDYKQLKKAARCLQAFEKKDFLPTGFKMKKTDSNHFVITKGCTDVAFVKGEPAPVSVVRLAFSNGMFPVICAPLYPQSLFDKLSVPFPPSQPFHKGFYTSGHLGSREVHVFREFHYFEKDCERLIKLLIEKGANPRKIALFQEGILSDPIDEERFKKYSGYAKTAFSLGMEDEGSYSLQGIIATCLYSQSKSLEAFIFHFQSLMRLLTSNSMNKKVWCDAIKGCSFPMADTLLKPLDKIFNDYCKATNSWFRSKDFNSQAMGKMEKAVSELINSKNCQGYWPILNELCYGILEQFYYIRKDLDLLDSEKNKIESFLKKGIGSDKKLTKIFNMCSAIRERAFVRNILRRLPEIPSTCPIVIKVGALHRYPLLKKLTEEYFKAKESEKSSLLKETIRK